MYRTLPCIVNILIEFVIFVCIIVESPFYFSLNEASEPQIANSAVIGSMPLTDAICIFFRWVGAICLYAGVSCMHFSMMGMFHVLEEINSQKNPSGPSWDDVTMSYVCFP